MNTEANDILEILKQGEKPSIPICKEPLPGQAKSLSFNPVKTLQEEPDFVIDLLALMAEVDVTEGTKAKAKEVALAVAQTKEKVTALDLVEAFDKVPDLKAFAAQLRKVASPGAYDNYFD